MNAVLDARANPDDGRIAHLLTLDGGDVGPSSQRWVCLSAPGGRLQVDIMEEEDIDGWLPIIKPGWLRPPDQAPPKEWSRWAGTEPQEADPELDDLTRAELAELSGPAAVVAETLDQWVRELHGVHGSLRHGAGLFLDLLAAAGHRVTPIDPGPPLDQLLPPPKD